MNTAQPIRTAQNLKSFKEYYLFQKPNLRNHLLIILGLNTALRISDILLLRWGDLYDAERDKPQAHLSLREQKTGKANCIRLNKNTVEAMKRYRDYLCGQKKKPEDNTFVFRGQKNENEPITRVQAFRIIKKAAKECGMDETVSCHSLRKTFGYCAWKQGISPVLLMHIYNHSSYQVTKRYLGIEQEDADYVFENIQI